ncbi:MAG: hypothetical protein AAGD25_24230 [Cyanobacteria bacterium P01_F01_bin.150]
MVFPDSSNIPSRQSVDPPDYTVSSSEPRSGSRSDWVYLVLGIFANVAIWAIALAYLRIAKPTYISSWAISLPGGGLVSNVDLPQIGSADTRLNSPYSNVNRDPRENYKFLATSRPVIKSASDKMDLTLSEFGKPRVEIVDNTTLMELSIQGESPEDARERAKALHDSLLARVAYLRTEEAAQQDAGSRSILKESREKLDLAQKRLSDFKARTGLVSNEQISQLSANIERLRERYVSVSAEQSNADSRLRELSDTLNVSADEASQAFVLRADQIFQQSIESYSAATSALDALNAQFGRNHPSVIRAKSKQDAARTSMLSRASSLLGQPITSQDIIRLNVGSDFEKSSREGLFEETVLAHIQAQGLSSQSQELSTQVDELEDKLRTLAQFSSTLESLQRDVTIAEAIFSSTIARLDLGRSDAFGSYPHIQLLTDPSLPKIQNSSGRIFVYVGAILGSIFTTTGVILLWRQSLLWRQGEWMLAAQAEMGYTEAEENGATVPSSNSDGTSGGKTADEDEQEELAV